MLDFNLSYSRSKAKEWTNTNLILLWVILKSNLTLGWKCFSVVKIAQPGWSLTYPAYFVAPVTTTSRWLLGYYRLFESSDFFFFPSPISFFFPQRQLWPTSITRGSSTEIWNLKISCCSREKKEWVKDPVNHPVITNTAKPQQRGHIKAFCLYVGYVE